MIRAACRALTVLGSLLGAAASAGGGIELGPELQVNTYTPGPQRASSVAGRGDGSFVVTWESGAQYGYQNAPGDSSSGVFLQRFDAAGAPLGTEQHVNTFTTAEQSRPIVSADAAGKFVVVWQSGCYYGTACSPDGSRFAVAARRFDAVGTPLGGELVVNTSTLGQQRYPAVSAAPTGEFVVTWGSSDDPRDHPPHVLGQRFAADGQPAGSEFQIDTATIGGQEFSAVSIDDAGKFVVVWEEYAGDTGAALAIRGRQLDASGAPLGELTVASNPAYASWGPAIAPLGGGDFVVAWQAYYYGDFIRSTEVHTRRFAADGTPLGPAMAVNSYVPGNQYHATVASDPAGNFIVAWTSSPYGGTGEDGDASGVFAQLFARDGSPLGGEQQVNAFTTQRQLDAAVAATGLGQFVVTWTSAASYGGSTSQDGDGPGIFARTVSLRGCAQTAECDDADQCTADACEGGLCLDRRQAGCCQLDTECYDGDECTFDTCVNHVCTFPAVPDCVRCQRDQTYCPKPDPCTRATCNLDVGRCEFERQPGCCLAAADCDDGLACTIGSCRENYTCEQTPVPDCVDCTGDAECSTGCLIAPETCVAGRCESPPGCPVVTIQDTDPLGAAGKLLASVRLPAEVPGTGKVKALITGTIGTRDAGDAPSRRCKSGKSVGSGRIVIEPGTEANALLALSKAGARCLAADPDGALPVDVTVRVVRKKKALGEVTASRTWRR